MQTCTATRAEYAALNLEIGTCKALSNGAISLNAVGSNTDCNLKCKRGYFNRKASVGAFVELQCSPGASNQPRGKLNLAAIACQSELDK